MYIDKWLDNALDYDIPEEDFWNMTLAELDRLFKSKRRIQKRQQQEKATYDYILAELIGQSVARIYSSAAEYPAIEEAYPALFDSKEMQEAKQKKKDELSALRFRQFAQAYNKKFDKEVSK